MKKVLHFYTDPNSMGGPTTYINIINNSQYLKQNYSFECVYQYKRLNRLRRKDIKRIVNEIKAISPDILHVHGLQGEGMIGVLCGRKAGCKNILVTVHGMQHDSFGTVGLKKFVYKNFIEKWTLKKADGVFCVCEAAEKSKYICKNTKKLIPYLHNCIPDMPEYDRDKERFSLGYDNNDIVIASVGRITLGKGAAVLTDIIKADHDISHKYLVIGDGGYLTTMQERLSDEIAQGKVAFTGSVSDVGKYLTASDVFVSTSYKENLSISILEAGYYGLPCIVTPVGGNAEIVQSGYNGEFFDIEDVEGYFKALNLILSDKKMMYANNSKENIKNKFSVSNFEVGLAKIYDSLTSNR